MVMFHILLGFFYVRINSNHKNNRNEANGNHKNNKIQANQISFDKNQFHEKFLDSIFI